MGRRARPVARASVQLRRALELSVSIIVVYVAAFAPAPVFGKCSQCAEYDRSIIINPGDTTDCLQCSSLDCVDAGGMVQQFDGESYCIKTNCTAGQEILTTYNCTNAIDSDVKRDRFVASDPAGYWFAAMRPPFGDAFPAALTTPSPTPATSPSATAAATPSPSPSPSPTATPKPPRLNITRIVVQGIGASFNLAFDPVTNTADVRTPVVRAPQAGGGEVSVTGENFPGPHPASIDVFIVSGSGTNNRECKAINGTIVSSTLITFRALRRKTSTRARGSYA
eukprot:tig00021042_g17593.t1